MGREQERAPLHECLLAHVRRGPRRFHIPGHKGGRGSFADLAASLGRDVFLHDLTELEGLDDLHNPAPGGPVEEAQVLAARAYGADRAHFVVGGSTAAVLAMVLATVGPGDTLLAPYPFHRSVVSAAILAGCALRTLPPELTGGLTPLPPNPRTVAAALEGVLPPPSAVLITNPTYHGVMADTEGLIEVCRAARVSLLIDAAHGAHLGFAAALPPSPMRDGVTACAVSLHKTAGALTPGSLLLLGGPGVATGRFSEERVSAALRMLQTSSPSFPVMASMDLARRCLVLRGREDWSRVVRLCRATRERVARDSGGLLRTPAYPEPRSEGWETDPTRLVFELAPHAPEHLTGPRLHESVSLAGVELEAAGWATLTAVATPGDAPRDHRRLVHALIQALARVEPDDPHPRRELALSLEKDCWQNPGPVEMTPGEAFRRARHRVPATRAAGRVAADVVSPYPPGIPLVIPGRRISPEAARYIEFLSRTGARAHGLSSGEVEVVD